MHPSTTRLFQVVSLLGSVVCKKSFHSGFCFIVRRFTTKSYRETMMEQLGEAMKPTPLAATIGPLQLIQFNYCLLAL